MLRGSLRSRLSSALAHADIKFGREAKIGGPAAWRGAELLANPWWGRDLTPTHVEELDTALRQAMQSGAIEWEGDIPMAVSPSVFRLREDGMAGMLRGLAEELENGSGATMLQGIPVERYTIPELSVMYLGMCGYIGNTVQQSSAGLRSKSRGYGMPIGHVKAEMRGKTPKDGKQVGAGTGLRRATPDATATQFAYPPSPKSFRRATTISGCIPIGKSRTACPWSTARTVTSSLP
eukprot:scaffold238416_cov36-Tisochrysis_lutea.AAC.1